IMVWAFPGLSRQLAAAPRSSELTRPCREILRGHGAVRAFQTTRAGASLLSPHDTIHDTSNLRLFQSGSAPHPALAIPHSWKSHPRSFYLSNTGRSSLNPAKRL